MNQKIRQIIVFKLILILLISMPLKLTFSAGEGSCTVMPTSVIRGSTGNNFTFTYTAAGIGITDNMNSGEIQISIPPTFSTPQTISSTGIGFVSIDTTNSTGISADLLTDLNDITGWFSSTANILLSTDSTTKKEGNSLKINVTAAATAGGLVYYNFSSPVNWITYNKVGFWIYTTKSTSSTSDLQFLISENANLSSPGIVLSIPVLNANQWYFIILDLPSVTTTRDQVLSFGFRYNNDFFGTDAGNIYIDEMFLGPTSKPTVVGNNIKVRLLSLYKDQTVIIKYNNVQVPTSVGDYTFTTQTRRDSSDSLASISASPIVSVISVAQKLVFDLPPTTMTAGTWSTQFVLKRQDDLGNPVTTGNTTVTITTNSPYGKGKFSRTQSGGSSTLTLTIPQGQDSISFYYYDETAGTWTITASSTGLVPATASITINPTTIGRKFLITLPGETFESGKGNSGTPSNQTSGSSFQIKVNYVDQYNNLINFTGSTNLTFSGPDCSSCTTPNKPKFNNIEYDDCSSANKKVTLSGISFTNGVSESINVVLFKAESTKIFVTDGTHNGESSEFNVSGGTLNKFKITKLDGTEFSGSEIFTAGETIGIKIIALDEYCNPTRISGIVDLYLLDNSNNQVSAPPLITNPISTTTITFSNESEKAISDFKVYRSSTGVTGYLLKIRARSRASGIHGDSNTFYIKHNVHKRYIIDNVSSPQIINTPFTITIKATDEWGNVCDGVAWATPYNGQANLSTSLGVGVISPVTTGSFSNGVKTESVSINTPATSLTIIVRDIVNSTITGSSNSFSVLGNLSSFEISNIGPQTSGQPFSITIKAKDSVGNDLVIGPFNNILISLAAEGSVIPNLTLSPNSVQLNGGVWSGNITISPPDPNVRIKVQNGNVTSYSNYFTLSDNIPTRFIFDTILSPKIAGTPFQITIRAVDYYNSPVINYNGSATISASTGPGTISPINITFNNGVWTGNVTLTTPNPSVVLTCFDPLTSAMGTSNAFQVTGGVETFRFSSISSPQYRNENIYITIQALDINGNIVTGFNGTVNLASTAGTITPTSVNFVGGMWSGNVKINAEGQNIRIQATYGNKTGFSDPFTILPFSQLVFEPNISSPQYVDVPFSITVKAKTPSGTQATWSGTLSLTCSLGNDKIDKTQLTMTNGTATDNVKISQRGTGVTLTVQATIYGTTISGTSNTFEVREGNKLVFITSAQVVPIDTSSGDIRVQIQDQDGNPVNATTNITVNLSSSSTTGRFSSDKNTWSTTNTFNVTIQSGQNQVLFYYRDSTPGVHTITAKATGLRDGTQTIRISVDGSGECTISPNSAFVRERNKDFVITFTSRASMDGGEIQITIPNVFSQPQRTSPTGEGHISITPGTGVTLGDWTISGYTIIIPINIMPKDRTITINYKNVTCSSAVGEYTFDVKTRGSGGTLAPISTMPKLSITLTSVSDVRVSLEPTSASAFAEYTITFKTSPVGQLLSNVDKVYIRFPSGTEIPGIIDSQSIQINTVSLNTPPSIDVPKREVTLITPVDIGANSDVTIKFTHRAKIKNPSSTGTNYQVEFWTDKDPTVKFSTAYSITSKTSIVNLTVSINPPGANSFGDITIGFRTVNALVKDVHTITFIFPSGFDVPPTISSNLITVGGTPLNEAPMIDSGTRTITIVTPRDFARTGTVEVVISKDAKIKNPARAGRYKLTVFTSQDNNPIESPEFSILTESQIRDVKCTVNPPTVNKVSRWEISFRTGTLGGLAVGGKIWIEFPSGTTIPGTIPSGSVTIDGLPAVTQKILALKIEITTPKEILPNSIVNIVITEDAQIRNPTSPSSTYKIKLSTTAEQTPVESDPFTIYQPPVSSFRIDPVNPNGLSGFYITRPVITLSAVSNYDTSPKIYFRWGNESYRLYTGPITAPEGINKLYFYAEDRFGNKEDERTIEVKVDTTPPVLLLVEPKEGAFVSNEQVTVVIESREELLDITVNNNKMIRQVGNRYSLTISLKEGENLLVVRGRDLAGNNQEIIFRVYLDKTPPQVKFTSPTSGQVVTVRSIKITGETEPNSKIKLRVSSVIGILKEEELTSDSKGSFEIEIKNLPPGFIGVTAEVTDQAGNVGRGTLNFIHKQTILLWVGKPEAQIDNEATFVDPDNKSVTPFILPPGRTMVPLRFISEAFGAKVDWDGATRTVTITWGGKTVKLTIGVYIAKVDGRDVRLDVAPVIRGGRTFVPIRFISEVFGAEVKWDATERKITITL